MDDTDLVARARAGDDEAFGALVDRHRTAVFRAAFAVLGTREDADDVAQEAFVTAFQKLQGFRSESSFKTWLLTIAWREALDRRRSLLRRLKRFVGQIEETWAEPPSLEKSSEAHLVERELVDNVRSIIRCLPASLRDTLLLAASGDMSYGEIAQVQAVSTGTVKWRVSEARRRIKDDLRRRGCADEA